MGQDVIPKIAKTIRNDNPQICVNKKTGYLLVCSNKNPTMQHSQTFRGGKWIGCAGLAKSHMHISPSSAPDASKFGVIVLNSKPRTCKRKTLESSVGETVWYYSNERVTINSCEHFKFCNYLQALYALIDVQLEEFRLPQDWKIQARKCQDYCAVKNAKPYTLTTIVRYP